ncbi:MAG: acyltransferase [Chloroflexi bacterium]|nr:acyltransferase [Chloroflexota bacterium]
MAQPASGTATTTSDEPQLIPAGGRIVAIDIVRGFAILWVILYHLWTDIKVLNIRTIPDTFRFVPHQVTHDPAGAPTAFTDAFLRVGALGVPLFMILSGLSLTLVAMRREPRHGETPRFLYRRLRRVMIPYWFGFVYTLAFAGALAFVQWQRHGGHSYAWFVRYGDFRIDGGQLFAGGLLVPRFWSHAWHFAPEGSLWFVLLIVQYYLLFPVLLPLLRRIGPWWFLAAALAVTLLSLNAMVAVDGNLIHRDSWVQTLAPFRIFEFALGMAGGYLMVRRPALLLEYTRAPLDILSIVVIGLLFFIGGNMIGIDSGDMVTFQSPMIALGMSLIFLPLVCKLPGRLEVSAPGRVVAWVGVISYTVLIVNEPLRSVTHTLTVEGASDAWRALWVGVIYMPLTLIAARPLAVFLGLVEREPRRTPASDAAAAAEGASLQA